MTTKGRKYIYINNVIVDGTIFQTQVLDWLHLYKRNHLDFKIIHAFHAKELRRPADVKRQIGYIKVSTPLSTGILFFLSSRNFFYLINALGILFHIVRFIYSHKEILIFSRALIGKEIRLLKRMFPKRIIFYYDARGAAAEENRYKAFKDHNYTLKKFEIIADTHFLEFKTLEAADRVFVVSRALRQYFYDTYYLDEGKCVIYPCLSDPDKFYYDPDLGSRVRGELKINKKVKVFVYSGGLGAWHMSEKLFAFFCEILKHESEALLLFLTKDKNAALEEISRFPDINNKFIILSVPNNEVYKYLNAADYGFLFRENSSVNKVASPTKFAEYMLCGLPVILTEGVGDYSEYTIRNNYGVIINEHELKNPATFDFKAFLEKRFDRELIADSGKKHFSKASIIGEIVEKFASVG